MTSKRPERILLGKIVGVSGLQGWLKVHSDTKPREAIGKYKQWLLGKDGHWHICKVKQVKPQGKRILGKLTDCDTREAAEALIGCDIAVEPDQLDTLASGQYYWVDLQGLQVVDSNGLDLGTIKRVFDTGANDVIVVKGERERLIPWIRDDVIKNVDMESRVVTVDWDPDF